MIRDFAPPTKEVYFPLGFHTSRAIWNRYSISELEAVPAVSGNPLVYIFRGLADRVNANRDSHTYATRPIHAGELFTFSLFTEVLRYLVDRYCLREQPGSLLEGLERVRIVHGASFVDRPIESFVDLFPPKVVLDGTLKEKDYLSGSTPDYPRRYAVGREIILLHLSTVNPALKPYDELFDDSDLRRRAPVEPLVKELESHFRALPPFPGFGETLFDFLTAPTRACPDSLDGQLEYILEHWSVLLPEDLVTRLRLASDIMKEEIRLRGLGPGPAQVLQFGLEYLDWGYPEPAAFTHDKDWMSNVVLIAKSVHVWLFQLSQRYERPVARIDEIPDEELDRLSRWGFTGLWLIGLWKRSPASQSIKRMMGNPEALSSAYSLYDYEIAEELGGEEALNRLRERAWNRGIRLASDMVPNHVGLYSRWVIEHPDWFLQLDYPPFPSYRFDGPDLSWDPQVALQIEDGYWNHSDAAVVFRRIDRHTGETRYIYHGNDGTSMPWNDTAQLNFILPQVREAVIQTILHVARQFPIIRFDAAMTLAKRHYQRLWFPKPGDAGAIPSRAEHGMTRADFDEVFPKEFWREVVDRIQQEVPDTLLLAEAFWLMEGYFVRTLGMHRVYNSAFMNMLKLEDNAKYRTTVRNVLEFSPEVVKRFVNFMNNPDERTAVDQFGKGDKYFGVAMMMVTMPGLPMFGHGQIEGFTEKYGMEYARSYWDEPVDEQMVERHEREIFPLMRRRHLFSGAENFALYDCVTPEGWVDESVFAYSNRDGADRALIVYNNAYNTSQGTIQWSTAINTGDAENKDLRRRTLAEALALDTSENCFYIFQDHPTGLEYIRPATDIARDGLSVRLNAYQYNAFLDFREVYDTDGTWRRLEQSLGGGGVPDMKDAYRELVLRPIHEPFREVMNASMLKALCGRPTPAVRKKLDAALAGFLKAIADNTSVRPDAVTIQKRLWDELEVLRTFAARVKKAKAPEKTAAFLLKPIPAGRKKGLDFWRVPLALALAHQVTRTRTEDDYSAHVTTDIDEWFLARIVADAFRELDPDEQSANMDALLVKVLSAYPSAVEFAPASGGVVVLRRMLHDPAVQRFLLMNRYDDVVYVNKEQFERLVYWLVFETCTTLMADGQFNKQALQTRFEIAEELLSAIEEAGYDVEQFLGLLTEEK